MRTAEFTSTEKGLGGQWGWRSVLGTIYTQKLNNYTFVVPIRLSDQYIGYGGFVLNCDMARVDNQIRLSDPEFDSENVLLLVHSSSVEVFAGTPEFVESTNNIDDIKCSIWVFKPGDILSVQGVNQKYLLSFVNEAEDAIKILDHPEVVKYS